MTPAGHASASVERVGKRTQLQNVWRVRWGPQGLGSRDIEDVIRVSMAGKISTRCWISKLEPPAGKYTGSSATLRTSDLSC